jgi:hypothetical protein
MMWRVGYAGEPNLPELGTLLRVDSQPVTTDSKHQPIKALFLWDVVLHQELVDQTFKDCPQIGP